MWEVPQSPGEKNVGMSVFLVTYDLRAPGQDYQSLYDRLSDLGQWARATESSIVLSNVTMTAEAIRNYLWAVMYQNDGLLVGRLNEACWIGIPQEVSNWIQSQVF